MLDVLVTLVLAPVVEEIVYRALLLGWVSRFMRSGPAAFLSAAVFGIGHWWAVGYGPALVVGTTAFGLIAGLAYLYGRDLRITIAAHAVYNFWQTMAGSLAGTAVAVLSMILVAFLAARIRSPASPRSQTR